VIRATTIALVLLASSGCDADVLVRFESETAALAPGLLGDFEGQDNQAGTDGWWYATDDMSGPDATLTFDAVSDRGTSHYCAHMKAGPTTDFGAWLGLDMPGGIYDASAFDMLSFSARAEPPLVLQITFIDILSDHHWYSAELELGSDWRSFALPLSGFVAGDVVLDRSQLTHLELWVTAPSPAFDLWVDDVWLTSGP
jgi:hypothetical protein